MSNKKQTAVEWLIEQIKSDQNQKALSTSEWLKVCEQAKQMEEQQKNKLSIHIQEGVENIWVYIEDGIVHVKHYNEFNVDKAKEGLNFVAVKFNPAKLKLDAEQ